MQRRETISETEISGKKILFFSPAFFRYENKIADKMREMGAIVDMYDVRSVKSAFGRAILKVFPSVFKKRSQKYYDDIIQENKEKDYDYILIVKCDMTPVSTLKKFRTVYPHAKLCLNLWDSVENIPGITEKFKYFDTLHSFDMSDCSKYSVLKFRPLFYADEFQKPIKNDGSYKYEISFMGTIHSDRYAAIRQVKEIAEEMGLSCYWFLYLQSNFIYWFYRIIKKEFRRVPKAEFSFEKLEAKEIAAVVEQSRIILDIQHPKQTGLTMRTIEMVGMNKKLITTNTLIKKYDFYHPNNIAVIDRNNIQIEQSFLDAPYKLPDRDIYEKYSLKSWILEVLK